MKAELEGNFSAIIGKMRQDLVSEFRGAIQEVVGLLPKEMVLPTSSPRAGYAQYPDPALCPGISSVESPPQQPILAPSPQLPRKSPVTPALLSLLSVFGHQVPPWQFAVASTAPISPVSLVHQIVS